jgi:aminopeptidase N
VFHRYRVRLTVGIAFTLLGSLRAPASLAGEFDPHSAARPEECRVEHLSLDLDVDFTAKQLYGRATLRLERAPDARELWLDTRGLSIESVTLEDGSLAKWEFLEEEPFLGQPMRIELDRDTSVVHIDYRTGPGAEALLWVDPEQTRGGHSPFVFSQSQTVFARSWIPIQDSPGLRFPYDATLHVPTGLLAVMSAQNPTVRREDGIYHFEMSDPVPAYLVALAVGDLEFRGYDDRTGVYAEPEMIDAAAWEFAQTPEMMASMERLFGPYRWGRYDILVLPPYFPFGGMENPRLTFATPTVLAGDRSLVSLIAHELAHSWSGNLVTNKSWEHFWLNEGLTVYLERRVMEELHGLEYSGMLEQLGFGDWLRDVESLGADHPNTALRVELDGLDPESGFTDVAYERGYFFFRLLENDMGRVRLDAFLSTYFEDNAFGSMDTDGFVTVLRATLTDEAYGRLKITDWIDGRGMPENTPRPRDGGFDRVRDAIAAWSSTQDAAALQVDGWSSHHWVQFLRDLPGTPTADALGRLDARFGLSQSKNSEILHVWLLRSIDAWYEPAFESLQEFLLGMGRRKFLSPLYTRLASTDRGLAFAREIYAHARPRYHPLAAKSIDRILEQGR